MAGNEWDIKVLALDGWMVKLKLSSQEKKENLLEKILELKNITEVSRMMISRK
jgi:hypothetical protein